MFRWPSTLLPVMVMLRLLLSMFSLLVCIVLLLSPVALLCILLCLIVVVVGDVQIGSCDVYATGYVDYIARISVVTLIVVNMVWGRIECGCNCC